MTSVWPPRSVVDEGTGTLPSPVVVPISVQRNGSQAGTGGVAEDYEGMRVRAQNASALRVFIYFFLFLPLKISIIQII